MHGHAEGNAEEHLRRRHARQTPLQEVGNRFSSCSLSSPSHCSSQVFCFSKHCFMWVWMCTGSFSSSLGCHVIILRMCLLPTFHCEVFPPTLRSGTYVLSFFCQPSSLVSLCKALDMLLVSIAGNSATYPCCLAPRMTRS